MADTEISKGGWGTACYARARKATLTPGYVFIHAHVPTENHVQSAKNFLVIAGMQLVHSYIAELDLVKCSKMEIYKELLYVHECV